MDHQSLVIPLVLALFASTASGLEIENPNTNEKVNSALLYPYHVSIQEQLTSAHICSGVLIGPDTVLTSAHCFHDDQNEFIYKKYYVQVGFTSVTFLNDNYPFWIDVSVIHTYREYTRYYDEYRKEEHINNDIAILKLTEGFNIASGTAVNTIGLPADKEDFANQFGTVTSFGTTTTQRVPDNTVVYPNPVKYIQYDNKDLFSASIYIENLSDTFYKSATQTKGVCHVDDGAPLVINNKIVGIESFSGAQCSGKRNYATYTKVTKYLRWIQEVLLDIPNEMSREYDIYGYYAREL